MHIPVAVSKKELVFWPWKYIQICIKIFYFQILEEQLLKLSIRELSGYCMNRTKAIKGRSHNSKIIVFTSRLAHKKQLKTRFSLISWWATFNDASALDALQDFSPIPMITFEKRISKNPFNKYKMFFEISQSNVDLTFICSEASHMLSRPILS